MWSKFKEVGNNGKDVFSYFPTDPSLDIWGFRPLFMSKLDKEPKREEIKEKMVVVLSLGFVSLI